MKSIWIKIIFLWAAIIAVSSLQSAPNLTETKVNENSNIQPKPKKIQSVKGALIVCDSTAIDSIRTKVKEEENVDFGNFQNKQNLKQSTNSK